MLVYCLSWSLLVSVGVRPPDEILAGFYSNEVARVSGHMMHVLLGAHHVMWALNSDVTYVWWHDNMHGMYTGYKKLPIVFRLSCEHVYYLDSYYLSHCWRKILRTFFFYLEGDKVILSSVLLFYLVGVIQILLYAAFRDKTKSIADKTKSCLNESSWLTILEYLLALLCLISFLRHNKIQNHVIPSDML